LLVNSCSVAVKTGRLNASFIYPNLGYGNGSLKPKGDFGQCQFGLLVFGLVVRTMADLVAVGIKRRDAEVGSHGFPILLGPKRIKLEVRQLATDGSPDLNRIRMEQLKM
jgi:hypothetical protein